MKTILLISPYWKEPHRWMVSSVKLAELWQRLGYRVVVACMGSESSVEKVSDTLTIHRRKDWFLRDPLNFGIALGFSGYVRRLIRDEKPDLIVVNKVLFWSSFATIPLRLRGHKILLTTDALVGITWHSPKFLARLLMRIGGWTIGWLVLRCAHHVVAFHPQPERVLKRLRILQKTQVIPTGIDPAPYAEIPSTTSQSPRDTVTVTYIGRLESVKGVADFLAAIIPLRKQHPQLTIQVVGWYTEKHPLVRQYEREVHFTGLRHDIPEVLRETDIFVLPSYSEGLSNALMEAMASGCSCIASDVGGNRFLIQNGISGFLFPPGDREALAAHIRRLIEDPAKRRAMGESARKRIMEQFSWNVVGEDYRRLFSHLIPSSQA